MGGWGQLSLLQGVSYLFFLIQFLKKHTLNPEITLLYKFHTQKALFKIPKICNIYFWPPPPLWNLSENSSDLVQPPFPQNVPLLWKSYACISYYLALIHTYLHICILVYLYMYTCIYIYNHIWCRQFLKALCPL